MGRKPYIKVTKRKPKTCSSCHLPGHWAKTCPKKDNWTKYINAKEPEKCTPSSLSDSSAPSDGYSQTGTSPPPIDLTGLFASNESPNENTSESPDPTQPTNLPPNQSPPPKNPPPQEAPTEAAKLEAAKQAGEMLASYWVAGLKMMSAYVGKHGGLEIGNEILKMNQIAAAHLAAKWALSTDVNEDDMAAFAVVGTGALMYGQGAWFFYDDNFKKPKETKANDPRAVNPSTGAPTQGPIPQPVSQPVPQQQNSRGTLAIAKPFPQYG